MVSLTGSKVLLAFSNLLLLACGCTLVTGGLIILLDPGRVLLSRLLSLGPITTLPHPLLYYVALGFAILGLILAGAGILGCWSSCFYSLYMLTMYFMLILLMLVGECAVYAVAWIWPQCFGLGIIPEQLVDVMQRNYGVAGQEQFTAAIDLAQSLFSCCGISTSIEYDTSLWRLQALGPSLAVPLTCCKLDNYQQASSYLDPRPLNSSFCQAVETDSQHGYRHSEGCGGHLENWLKEQYIIFLGVGLITVLIEFIVLLTTILVCTKLYKHKHNLKEDAKNELQELPKDNKISYETSVNQVPFAYSNDAYTVNSSYRQNYRLAKKQNGY